jgi:tetratricopeptide (TPR) repeat protein
MRSSTRLSAILLIGTLLFLPACKSDEERAEEFYQSALQLLEEGEIERALVELRNVFERDGFHREARMLYARQALELGDIDEAYGQYLRVVEQYPETLEARTILALIALERRNWSEATRHGEAAIALNPDTSDTRAIDAALSYRRALLDRDPRLEADAVARARQVLADDPNSLAAIRVVIDSLLRADTLQEGLAQVEVALEISPDSREFNFLRAQLLQDLGEDEGFGLQLERMYDLFPEDTAIRDALMDWYMERDDYENAIFFLRNEAGPVTEDPGGNMAVIEMMRTAGRDEEADAELDALIEAAEGTVAAQLYEAVRAWDAFEDGQQDAAIAELQEILADATPSEQTHRVRLLLARMLDATGNLVGAREQVEIVLAEDESNVDALKLRSEWLIRSDTLGQAIIDLRLALDQSPGDPEIFLLMGEAHLRDNSPALAQERFASAARVSGNAPPYALRYARFLMERNRNRQAASLLDNALRRNPENFEIMGLLGDAYLRQQDWVQAQTITDRLRALDTPVAQQLAQAYQSSILLSQNRIDEGLDFLRAQIAEESSENVASELLLVRALLRTDRVDEAVIFAEEQAARNPDSVPLALLHANVVALQGDLLEAERIYRDLLSRQPEIEAAITQLQALLRASDRVEEAEEVILAGLESLPQSRTLLLLQAYRQERIGEYQNAIDLYEQLYARNNGDLLVVNNLASMLSNYSTDPQDIARAREIAQRLEGRPNPAFHDTLGWLAYLTGDTRRAIGLLESAAVAFPEEASVHIHLGLAYAEAGRNAEARQRLEHAMAMPQTKIDDLYVDQAKALLNSL